MIGLCWWGMTMLCHFDLLLGSLTSTQSFSGCPRVVLSLGGLERAVHALGIKAPAVDARLVGEIDDAQHLLRRATKNHTVRRGRNEVGLASAFDALVLVARTIKLVAGG